MDQIEKELLLERGNDFFFYPQEYVNELIDERYLKRFGNYKYMRDIT